MPNSNLPDRGCDPIGDILSLSSGSKRMPVTKKDQLLQSGLMTFPQIWVESVCDESSDDDYDDEDDQSRLRRRTHDPSKSIRCLSSSSTDVSFESASTASLSPASTRQNSLQLMSRENSVEVTGLNAEPEPEPTLAFLFFQIQAEIDETVRKSTNILLTRTLSGCLSSLIRRDNLSLLQLIQVRWNELVVN